MDGGQVHLLDAEGQAIALAEGWRIQGVLTRRPIAAILGRLAVTEGALRLSPLSLITHPPEAGRVRLG